MGFYLTTTTHAYDGIYGPKPDQTWMEHPTEQDGICPNCIKNRNHKNGEPWTE